jgi:membrane-bound inhibitor of C-type lysozyme
MVRFTLLAFFLGVAIMVSSCCHSKPSKPALAVTGGDTVVYQTDAGEKIIARYFCLSDSSLNFVKVTLPGGKEFTLPQSMSASGVRYTDDRELVWWTKGNSAFAEKRDSVGQWVKLFDCQESENR